MNRDYRVRVESRSRDEVGQLVAAFNDMVEQVEARDAALAGARDSLERRVEERTRELQQQVTERTAAEARLAENDARLTEAQGIAQLGSWKWDPDTGSVTWSDEVYRTHGLLPAGFGGTLEHFIACAHPEDRGLVREALLAARDGSRPLTLDYRVIRPDGSVRFLHCARQDDLGFRRPSGAPAGDAAGHHREAPRRPGDPGPEQRARSAHGRAGGSEQGARGLLVLRLARPAGAAASDQRLLADAHRGLRRGPGCHGSALPRRDREQRQLHRQPDLMTRRFDGLRGRRWSRATSTWRPSPGRSGRTAGARPETRRGVAPGGPATVPGDRAMPAGLREPHRQRPEGTRAAASGLSSRSAAQPVATS